METVIQKYLRNEFETIDDYNAQAGELAEPYRFLVIADFPAGFEGDAFRRLSSIASSGAALRRLHADHAATPACPSPPASHLDDLRSAQRQPRAATATSSSGRTRCSSSSR